MAKKVNLGQIQQKIDVFYDGRCGMCCTFINWLEKQDHVLLVCCYDYHNELAQIVFNNIADYDPSKEIVVRVNGEDVYTGAKGWVCCLWSCKKHQGLAKKMNNMILLPMAQRTCHFISNNRLGISKLLFRKKTREITKDLVEKKNMKNNKLECEGGCRK